MKMTMRTTVGIGAACFGAGLHLLTAGHPMLAGAVGGAAVAWPAVRDYRERRRPVAHVVEAVEAGDTEAWTVAA